MIDTTRFVAAGEVTTKIDVGMSLRTTPMEAWRALATAEGWRAFFETEARIGMHIGGPYEVVFMPDNPPGQRGSEGCQVLSYVPGAMLSFSWNGPPELPLARGWNTWVVVDFNEVTAGVTRVRFRHLGFGQGGQWPDTVTYFERAWPMILDALGRHFGRA